MNQTEPAEPATPTLHTITSPFGPNPSLASLLLAMEWPHPSAVGRVMFEIMTRGGILEFSHDASGDLIPELHGGYGVRELGETLSPKERRDVRVRLAEYQEFLDTQQRIALRTGLLRPVSPKLEIVTP